ncbi:uncharacterized protein LOC121055298 [Oryza brachyantha]|uniref:uncharacterized protein LOC121055298 n=1 Tax=Oryza brachyantha TaxID=4533 RepID=UPI001ADD592A|nr:uncharacterized protein LOC121055298 [Oryza brachyantha]
MRIRLCQLLKIREGDACGSSVTVYFQIDYQRTWRCILCKNRSLPLLVDRSAASGKERRGEPVAMEGFIPFVFGVIKTRRKRRPGRCYERLHSPGGAAGGAAGGGGGSAGAYLSQSCRYPARAHPADEELELPCYDGVRRRASPGGFSGELSAVVGGGDGDDRGVSRSLRFSRMRVLACVSGA